jgi:hypothetical protein
MDRTSALSAIYLNKLPASMSSSGGISCRSISDPMPVPHALSDTNTGQPASLSLHH